MDRCLLDTSTLSDVIDLAGERSFRVGRHAMAYLRSHGQFSFSEVSCYEILRGLRKKQATAQELRFQEFCRHCDRLPVTAEIFDRAATLWAVGQSHGITVDDADLLIAATGLILGLPVVSANPRHFRWIVGLTHYNWRE